MSLHLLYLRKETQILEDQSLVPEKIGYAGRFQLFGGVWNLGQSYVPWQ